MERFRGCSRGNFSEETTLLASFPCSNPPLIVAPLKWEAITGVKRDREEVEVAGEGVVSKHISRGTLLCFSLPLSRQTLYIRKVLSWPIL